MEYNACILLLLYDKNWFLLLYMSLMYSHLGEEGGCQEWKRLEEGCERYGEHPISSKTNLDSLVIY